MTTITVTLSEKEMAALEGLTTEQEMNKTAVMRAALRLYQSVHIYAKNGWEFDFVDAQGRSHRQMMGKAILGIGPLPTATPIAYHGSDIHQRIQAEALATHEELIKHGTL